LHLQERARLGIHRGFPELRRVHLAETLVALDLEALARGEHEAIERALQAGNELGLLTLAEGVGRIADGRQLARDLARLLELGARDELAVEDVAMLGPVRPRGHDEAETGVLAVVLELDAERQ